MIKFQMPLFIEEKQDNKKWNSVSVNVIDLKPPISQNIH